MQTTEFFLNMLKLERERQIAKGYDNQSDEIQNNGSEMAQAAASFALMAAGIEGDDRAAGLESALFNWPESWDPLVIAKEGMTTVECLVKAGALIVAELERLSRLED